MRGGAIPVLVWFLLLGAAMTVLGLWHDQHARPLEIYGLALLIVLSVVALAVLGGGRRALQRGAPEGESGPDALPDISFGALLTAVGVATFAFGFVFGHFFTYFGAALVVGGLGRSVLEQRSQRRSLRELAAARSRPTAGTGRERGPRGERGAG